MKKIYFAAFVSLLISGVAHAQTPIVDSVQTGGSYANSVYYSLRDGKVTEVVNNNWQLAFSIGSFTVGVRANTATNGSADGFCTVYEKAGVDSAIWASFDTAGYSTWTHLNNSDEDWETGAFNQNISGQFDYGWGEYDPASHEVIGHRIYLVVVKSGSNMLYKKVWVVSKVSGNWTVRFANLDGSNDQTVTINSSSYASKNFAYLSLLTGQLVDREPTNDAWDFVYTRYDAKQPSGVYYLSMGFLTNYGVQTSEVRGKDETLATLADTTGASDNISTIGYDWKALNASFTYDMVDSLCYFVKATDGAYWKLVFNAFLSGSSPTGTGRTVFTKTKLTFGSGVSTTGEAIRNLTAYPNPTTGMLHVLFDASLNNSQVEVIDLTGKSVYQANIRSNGFTQHPIDLSSLNKGIYFLSVSAGESRSVQKIMVN